MLFPVESSRPLHDPWHGLLVSVVIGPMHTKLARMWNRLGVPCAKTCVFTTVLTMALAAMKPRLTMRKLNKIQAVLQLFRWLLMLIYKIIVCEVPIICRKPSAACKIHYQSPSRGLAELWRCHKDIKLDCFTVHGMTLSACIYSNQHVCGFMWDMEQFNKLCFVGLTNISKTQNWCK